MVNDGRDSKAADRQGKRTLCARESQGKGVTLDNFVLNFSVISSKAISLTFSCGI